MTSQEKRVVVTGLGVLAPNGHNVQEFESALRNGRTGIRHIPEMDEFKFSCQVAAIPQGVEELCVANFSEELLMSMNCAQRYAALAAVECWRDAGFEVPSETDDEAIDWETGAVFGTGIGGMETIAERVAPLVNEKKIRRLGSTAVEQVMASGVSARLSGILALGNQVTTNSSACSTGTEAVIEGLYRIRAGRSSRMICGGTEAATRYIWAGFDAMRVLARKWNDSPGKASRPLSASAGGFVPGAGAGALMLESLESASKRGARIYAEVLGGSINCGGHRSGGSMTAPNPQGVERCIKEALSESKITADQVNLISGHLTATGADPKEVWAWSRALGRSTEDFPTILSTKSLIGHTLGAAGAIESIAAILMLHSDFVHPSVNCEDVHPDLVAFEGSIPRKAKENAGNDIVMKASFGFGDVNACVSFQRWQA